MQTFVGKFQSGQSFLRSLSDTKLSSSPLHSLEIKLAFDDTKDGTAPGPDGHQPSLYKRGGTPMRRIFTAMFRACWRLGHQSSQWASSALRMLFKAGNRADVTNYRGISLLSVAGNIYERVVYNRLNELLVHRQRLPAELLGFMSKHGQRHTLYPAYESIKHNRRAGKCVVVLSADVKKAYPTMLRTQMLQDLKDLGAGENLYNAIACMYENNTSTILTFRNPESLQRRALWKTASGKAPFSRPYCTACSQLVLCESSEHQRTPNLACTLVASGQAPRCGPTISSL